MFNKNEHSQVPLLDRSAPFMNDIAVSKDGVMVGVSQFSPLHALSQQQGPNIWISSIFISAFHANIGKHFPLNMIIRVSDQFKRLNFLIF